MNYEYGLRLQSHYLIFLEQKIAGLKTPGRFPTNQRAVHVGIIKKGLEDVRQCVFAENIEKLQSLEEDFTEFEEREKRKPSRIPLSI